MSTPKEFFSFAELIIEDFKNYHQGDVYKRGVANRLYYSAFHASKEYHERLPCPGSVGQANGIHQQLISSLSFPAIPRGDEFYKSVAISKSLRAAMQFRVKADYKLKEFFSEDDFKETMAHCQMILNNTN